MCEFWSGEIAGLCRREGTLRDPLAAELPVGFLRKQRVAIARKQARQQPGKPGRVGLPIVPAQATWLLHACAIVPALGWPETG